MTRQPLHIRTAMAPPRQHRGLEERWEEMPPARRKKVTFKREYPPQQRSRTLGTSGD